MKQKQKLNFSMLLGLGVMLLILTAATAIEFFKGTKTHVTFAAFFTTAWLPLLFAVFLYRKKKDSDVLRYLLGFGYILMYAVSLFTGSTILVFVYFMPMLPMIMIHNDVRLVGSCGIMATILNIIYVVLRIVNGNFTDGDIVNFEIMLAAVLLCSVLTFYSTGVSRKIAISLADTMSSIQTTVQTVQEKTGEISSNMNELALSAKNTANAMSEVSEGNMKTAEAVMEQQRMTENIQDHIKLATSAAQEIHSLSKNTAGVVTSGKEGMEELLTVTKKSSESSKSMEQNVQTLKQQMENAKHIITLIQSISTQTTLLAFNASIEAGRAGAAGKGFAVVAGEINDLSKQTQEATTQINDIIENLLSETENVEKTQKENDRLSAVQRELIQTAKTQFDNISSQVGRMEEQSKEQSERMNEIEGANNHISDSIQTISAIIEEVTASSEETLKTSVGNMETAQDVETAVSSLRTEMEKFESSQNQ